MPGLANQQQVMIIGDDDAHHEGGDDHPYRTVRFPFSSLVHLGARNTSDAKPRVATGCP
jgi:hypothetical protein